MPVAWGRARPAFLLFAIAWGGFIWWMSSGVRRIGQPTFLWDVLRNGGHAVLFSVLSALLLRGLPPARAVRCAGAVLCSLYGFVDEWHQSWVVGRTPAFSDFVTDTCGVVFGWTVIVWLESWWPFPERRAATSLRLVAAGLACVAAAVLASV